MAMLETAREALPQLVSVTDWAARATPMLWALKVRVEGATPPPDLAPCR